MIDPVVIIAVRKKDDKAFRLLVDQQNSRAKE